MKALVVLVLLTMLVSAAAPSDPVPGQLVVENEPRWTSPSVNFTTITQGQSGVFQTIWIDDVSLHSFIFSTDDSGIWVNTSPKTLSGKVTNAVTTYTIQSASGIVHWRMYATDGKNWNATNIEEFTVTAKPQPTTTNSNSANQSLNQTTTEVTNTSSNVTTDTSGSTNRTTNTSQTASGASTTNSTSTNSATVSGARTATENISSASNATNPRSRDATTSAQIVRNSSVETATIPPISNTEFTDSGNSVQARDVSDREPFESTSNTPPQQSQRGSAREGQTTNPNNRPTTNTQARAPPTVRVPPTAERIAPIIPKAPEPESTGVSTLLLITTFVVVLGGGGIFAYLRSQQTGVTIPVPEVSLPETSVNMREYVNTMIATGYHPQAIERSLMAAGHDPVIVRRQLNLHQTSPHQYITRMAAMGFTRQQIQTALLQAGYKPIDIHNLFEESYGY